MTLYPPNQKQPHMTTYWCIVPEKAIPICGFSTRDSALRYQVDNAVAGPIKLYDTRTGQYVEARHPGSCGHCGRTTGQHHPDCPLWDSHVDNYEAEV